MKIHNGRMILESVENGPLIWPTIEENGVTRPKKYSELSATESIQADCDIKTTNIILQGLPPEVYALFEETFSEAWDHFKDLLRACPHHGFTELHQLDTFYNALNPTDQDSLNAAAGGNLLTKTPRDALTIIKNKSKVCNSRNKPVVSKVSANTSSSITACPSEMAALTDVVNVVLRHVKTSPPETIKAIS
ncbi:hypothetical protein Tco_0067454 [Tanacetum coccineum]